MKCNIDAKGKAVRLRAGIILAAIGIAAAGLAALGVLEGPVSWTSSVALIVIGSIAIFEARAGWCIVRAMGFKTPI